MQAIETKIINRIYGYGRGWAFFKNDFADLGQADAIDKALSRLTAAGRIRRVMRGMYDYPKYSSLLKKDLSADIDQVAHALARKFGWDIQISGNAALNLLRLSTQVPTRYVYHSSGPSKTYQLDTISLSFKKATLKEMGLKYPQSALLVQALKALDKKVLTQQEQATIIAYFPKPLHAKIIKDTRYVTSWVHELIKSCFKRAA